MNGGNSLAPKWGSVALNRGGVARRIFVRPSGHNCARQPSTERNHLDGTRNPGRCYAPRARNSCIYFSYTSYIHYAQGRRGLSDLVVFRSRRYTLCSALPYRSLVKYPGAQASGLSR